MSLLEDFNLLINGGLRNDTIYMVKGVPSSGKTSFGITLLKEFLGKGRKCVYVTTEMDPADIIANAKSSFGLDLEEYAKKGLFFWVDGYSWRLQKKSEVIADIANLSDLSTVINNTLTKEKDFFLLFDSLTSLFLYNDPEVVTKFTQIQVARFRNKDVLGMLLLEEGVTDKKTTDTLSYFVDGLFETKLQDEQGDLKRYFRVFSMKLASHKTQWMPFQIDNTGFHFVGGIK